MKINSRTVKTLISIVTCAAFFVSTFSFDLALAMETNFAPKNVHTKPVEVNSFMLPRNLGTVRDSWVPSQGNARRTVVHIQDAHCDYGAQHKISDIISYLNKEYGIETVNLEGGQGEYNLGLFNHMLDPNIKEKVTDYFVANGRMNGAEYFAVNNIGKTDLWGIENADLYIKNLEAYRSFLEHKPYANRYVDVFEEAINNLKQSIYSQRLLEFDEKYMQYKSGDMEFKEYLAFIISLGGQEDMDLTMYPNVHLCAKTMNEESEIDFRIANEERDKLISLLEKKISKKELEELIIKTVEFKSRIITEGGFYSYLLDKAYQVNINTKQYHELRKYTKYISMYNDVDTAMVMKEIESLEAAIKDTYFETDDQRKLDYLSTNLAVMSKLFNARLTPEGYEYYNEHKAAFSMDNYISFINSKMPGGDIIAKHGEGIYELDKYREHMVNFYECSYERDRAFLGNMKYSDNNAVVITGGFHTENLCELFKKNNVAYVSIMPNFENMEGYECPYFSLLSGEPNPIESKIENMLFSTIAIANILSSKLMNKIPGGKRKQALFALHAVWKWLSMNGQGIIIQVNTDEGLKVIGAITRDGERISSRRTNAEDYTVVNLDDLMADLGAELEGVNVADIEDASDTADEARVDEIEAKPIERSVLTRIVQALANATSMLLLFPLMAVILTAVSCGRVEDVPATPSSEPPAAAKPAEKSDTPGAVSQAEPEAEQDDQAVTGEGPEGAIVIPESRIVIQGQELFVDLRNIPIPQLQANEDGANLGGYTIELVFSEDMNLPVKPFFKHVDRSSGGEIWQDVYAPAAERPKNGVVSFNPGLEERPGDEFDVATERSVAVGAEVVGDVNQAKQSLVGIRLVFTENAGTQMEDSDQAGVSGQGQDDSDRPVGFEIDIPNDGVQIQIRGNELYASLEGVNIPDIGQSGPGEGLDLSKKKIIIEAVFKQGSGIANVTMQGFIKNGTEFEWRNSEEGQSEHDVYSIDLTQPGFGIVNDVHEFGIKVVNGDVNMVNEALVGFHFMFGNEQVAPAETDGSGLVIITEEAMPATETVSVSLVGQKWDYTDNIRSVLLNRDGKSLRWTVNLRGEGFKQRMSLAKRVRWNELVSDIGAMKTDLTKTKIPGSKDGPKDMRNMKVSYTLQVSNEEFVDTNNPNGARFFAISDNGQMQWSKWYNIANRRITVGPYTPYNPGDVGAQGDGAFSQPTFNSARVVAIGVEVNLAGWESVKDPMKRRELAFRRHNNLALLLKDVAIEVEVAVEGEKPAPVKQPAVQEWLDLNAPPAEPVSPEHFRAHSGISYYWSPDSYGYDIGGDTGLSTKYDLLVQRAENFKKRDINVIRQFTLCDIRNNAITFDASGMPLDYDRRAVKDYLAIFAAAKAAGRKVSAPILDYTFADGVSVEDGNTVGEHASVLTNPEHQQAFFDIMRRMLTEVKQGIDKYKLHDAVLAWEPVNEAILMKAATEEQRRQFVSGLADVIVSVFGKDVPVSLSIKEFRLLDFWRPLIERLQGEGVEVIVQFHHYGELTEIPNRGQLGLAEGTKVVIWEYTPGEDIGEVVKYVYDNGYDGFAAWHDAEFDLTKVLDKYQQALKDLGRVDQSPFGLPDGDAIAKLTSFGIIVREELPISDALRNWNIEHEKWHAWLNDHVDATDEVKEVMAALLAFKDAELDKHLKALLRAFCVINPEEVPEDLSDETLVYDVMNYFASTRPGYRQVLVNVMPATIAAMIKDVLAEEAEFDDINVLSAREELYSAAEKMVPAIVDIIRRDVPTYDVAPADFEGKSKVEALLQEARRRLGSDGHNIHTGFYAMGAGENSFENAKQEVESMMGLFSKDAAQDKATRMMIRLLSEPGRDVRGEMQSYIFGRLTEGYAIPETEARAIVDNNVLIVEEQVADKAHLNNVIDLFIDIGTMEYHRYERGDYPGQTAPDSLVVSLTNLLRLSVTNLDDLTVNNLKDYISRILVGDIILMIKAIDWQSIREWKDKNDKVLQAV